MKGGKIMANDLVFVGEKLVNICDMSNFIWNKPNNIEEEKIQINGNEIKRYVVKVKKIDIIERLKNENSITKETIQYSLECYLRASSVPSQCNLLSGALCRKIKLEIINMK